MKFKQKYTWACDHLKTSNLSADNFQKILDLDWFDAWARDTVKWYDFLKNKLEPAIIWKLVTCQRITSKNTRPRWVDTWARDTVGVR